MEGFFTFLIGITCFGILLFLIYGVVSKISGRPIKNSGIVSGGQTIADPEMLDNVGRGLRKLVDKKYKVRKQIEEETNEELAKTISPIDRLIQGCWFIGSFPHDSHSCRNDEAKSFILNAIGFLDTFKYKTSISDLAMRYLTEEEKNKVNKLHVELLQQKAKLTAEITEKYNQKKDELLKYL